MLAKIFYRYKNACTLKNIQKSIIGICVAGFFGAFSGLALAAPEDAKIELWRLDCGEMIIDDISYFSDTYKYEGQSATITNGCYLVRHGDQYLL